MLIKCPLIQHRRERKLSVLNGSFGFAGIPANRPFNEGFLASHRNEIRRFMLCQVCPGHFNDRFFGLGSRLSPAGRQQVIQLAHCCVHALLKRLFLGLCVCQAAHKPLRFFPDNGSLI